MNIALGYLSLCIALCGYFVYLRDTYRGHTRPHGFTWLIWACLNGIIFYEQLANGGGAGAWVTGLAFAADGNIAFMAFARGSHRITTIDWICLVLGALALGVLLFTPSSVLSVTLACMAFAVGFIPTIRKSRLHPHHETATTFAINGTKYLAAIFALEAYSYTTLSYPITISVSNIFFVAFLLACRRFKHRIKR